MTLMTQNILAFPSGLYVDPTPAETTIVVPCYNEEDRLDGEMFLQTLSKSAGLRFLFVNDGSTDGTLNLLVDLQLVNPDQIEVMHLPRNAGKCEAVRKGLQRACAMGAKSVGYWDADLATPLNAIADFVTVMDRFDSVDVVFGSRRQLLGHRINRTMSRRFVSRMCAGMARLATGLPVGDTQCGAKLLRNTPTLQAALKNPFSAGWLFDVELFSRLSATSTEPERIFFEQPLAEWDEVAGSKVSARAIGRAGVQMLRLIANRYVRMARLALTRSNVVAAQTETV